VPCGQSREDAIGQLEKKKKKKIIIKKIVFFFLKIKNKKKNQPKNQTIAEDSACSFKKETQKDPGKVGPRPARRADLNSTGGQGGLRAKFLWFRGSGGSEFS